MTYVLLALLFLLSAILIAPRAIRRLREQADAALIEYRDNGFDSNGERIEFTTWFLHYRKEESTHAQPSRRTH